MMERPPLTHVVKLDDGETRTVKWTYGLSQDLQRMVPDPAMALEVAIGDPVARDYLVRRALTPLQKIVTDDKELIQAEDLNLGDPDEVANLLEWITGHLLYFFASSAGKLKKLGEALEKNLGVKTPPAPSQPGSES